MPKKEEKYHHNHYPLNPMDKYDRIRFILLL